MSNINQVSSLEELWLASQSGLRLNCPGSTMFETGSVPAETIMHMPASVVYSLIKTGLFIEGKNDRF